MTASPTAQAAEARIARLTRAIGDGPHSQEIDQDEVIHDILVALRDDVALGLLEKKAA